MLFYDYPQYAISFEKILCLPYKYEVIQEK